MKNVTRLEDMREHMKEWETLILSNNCLDADLNPIVEVGAEAGNQFLWYSQSIGNEKEGFFWLSRPIVYEQIQSIEMKTKAQIVNGKEYSSFRIRLNTDDIFFYFPAWEEDDYNDAINYLENKLLCLGV